MASLEETISNLRQFAQGRTFHTIYADPPWQFQNRTGKVAPEHIGAYVKEMKEAVLDQ